MKVNRIKITDLSMLSFLILIYLYLPAKGWARQEITLLEPQNGSYLSLGMAPTFKWEGETKSWYFVIFSSNSDFHLPIWVMFSPFDEFNPNINWWQSLLGYLKVAEGERVYWKTMGLTWGIPYSDSWHLTIGDLYTHSQIVFTSYRDDGFGDIYIMNPDGSNLRRLTESYGFDWRPRLSPNGDQIAFESSRFCNNPNCLMSLPTMIYVMNSDGGNPHRLTENDINQFKEHTPCWSSDGKKIVFSVSSGYTNFFARIYIINSDGTGHVGLTSEDYFQGNDVDPVFSPDGKVIAFKSERISSSIPDYLGDIYLIDIDGNNLLRLTYFDQGEERLSLYNNFIFTNDGKKIFFKARNSDDWGLYQINIDGTGLSKILDIKSTKTTGPFWNHFDLSPDGSKFVFTSLEFDAFKNEEIYTMDIDGSNQERLTNDSMIDRWPNWGFYK